MPIAQLLRLDPVATPALAAPGVQVAPQDARLIARLRRWADAAQLAPALDLDRACAMIGAPRTGEQDPDHDGRLLMSALSTAAERRLVLHPMGAALASADELLLLRLLERLQAGDGASARFLVARRVGRRDRRAVLFLSARLAASLSAAA